MDHRRKAGNIHFAETGFDLSLIIERRFQDDLSVFKMLDPRKYLFKGPFPKNSNKL